jgi:hypothetical protein
MFMEVNASAGGAKPISLQSAAPKRQSRHTRADPVGALLPQRRGLAEHIHWSHGRYAGNDQKAAGTGKIRYAVRWVCLGWLWCLSR